MNSIAEIFESGKFKNWVIANAPTWLVDDLVQDVALALCEMDHVKIQKIISEGRLLTYSIAIAKLKIYDDKKRLQKKYSTHFLPVGYKQPEANKLKTKDDVVNILEPVEILLIEALVSCDGNISNLSKEAGISRTHIYTMIQKIKEKKCQIYI